MLSNSGHDAAVGEMEGGVGEERVGRGGRQNEVYHDD